MKKKFINIGIIFLALIVISCNHTDQKLRTVNSVEANKAYLPKDSTILRKVPNTPEAVYAKPEVPVLCYHRIEDGRKDDYRVSPAAFASQIKILADSGYHSISPSQLYNYLVYNNALPEKPFMITFDDSRIEHFLIAAPELEKYGFRGVFFIMTITYDKKNYMTREQIAQLAKAGHTIGLHSWDHTKVTKYTEASDWQKQVAEPKIKLEKITGKAIECWAYPYGIYDHRSAEFLSKYFKLSFILSTQRDSTEPLQTIRRMIIPEWTPQDMFNTMHRTFNKKKS